MLPRMVHLLVMQGGYIVGSQARRMSGIEDTTTKKSDWDVIIPFNKWHQVAPMIPMEAVPNSFGGWKFKSNGFDVDVWPDDVIRYLVQCKLEGVKETVVFDYMNNRVLSSRHIT